MTGYSFLLKAEDIVRASVPDKEYLPITGLAAFTKNAALLAYGADSQPLKDGAVCYFYNLLKSWFFILLTRSPSLNLSPELAPCASEGHFLRVIILTRKLSTCPPQPGEITFPFSKTLAWKFVNTDTSTRRQLGWTLKALRLI